MADDRVSMFISHKMATHKRAAARIKTILEARAERLDVYICEEIPAGDRWREWITNRLAHSQLLLVLLPHRATDLTWIADEIGRFESACPAGHLVILKSPSDPVPDIVRDRQIIDIGIDQLHERFLRPLYCQSTLTALEVPLNARVSDVDLQRDAGQIEEALLGDLRIESFGESLIIETVDLAVTTAQDLGNARVRAPNGCASILNWSLHTFSWNQLRARAEEEKGKGTFWVNEMEQVIIEVARQDRPRVMTSTFRGRGQVAGQIFRPQLERVDYINDIPVRFYFAFHEVLAPELVRGPGPIGDVFNLLYIATRVRWEVLNPFLDVSSTGGTLSSRLEMSEEAQRDVISRVRTSLRIIEAEAERHNMIEDGLNAFEDTDRALVLQLIQKRDWIRRAIEAAADRKNFLQLMAELTHGLTFNCEATEVLATKYLELVREDRQRVLRMLAQSSSNEAQLN